MLQVFDQMPDREIGRVALPVVAVLLPKLERGDVRGRQYLHFVPGRLERRPDQPLVLRRQAAEQDRDAVTLSCRKRAFDGSLEMGAWLLGRDARLKARAFRFNAPM